MPDAGRTWRDMTVIGRPCASLALRSLTLVSAIACSRPPAEVPLQAPGIEPSAESTAVLEAEPEATAQDTASAATEQRAPLACPESGECLPPPTWATKVCQEVNQDVALFMFRGNTPWQRLYLKVREVEAANASGGATVPGVVRFDEELIVMRHRDEGKGGVVVGEGGGSYDALRWNGSCVSLDGNEVTTRKPPKPKYSRVEWKWLSDEMRAALREDETVLETYRARRKECRGATMGSVTKQCERLDRKLVSDIVKYVRSAPDLPRP